MSKKKEVKAVITAIRVEELDLEEEEFSDFFKRLRKKYSKALDTNKISIQIVD